LQKNQCIMLGKSPNQAQTDLFKSLLSHQLNPNHALYRLANVIPWKELEEAFAPRYSRVGLPSKPLRRMIALLVLKHLYNLSDERVVAHWETDAYFQYFAGEATMQWGQPCAASDLVHFRHRLGEEGITKLFALSIALHGDKVKKAKEVIVDTTLQEKNVTFPTDAKLYRKVIAKCNAMAQQWGVKLRQSYRFVVHRLCYAQRYAHLPRRAKQARQALRKLRTLAGRQVRDLQRHWVKLGREECYAPILALMERIVSQQRGDKNKVYSLHAPETSCIAKGKAHKKYEFGSKVSVASLSGSKVVVGITSFVGNPHDGKTLATALDQVAQWTGRRYERVLVDQGYRGHGDVGEASVIMPGKKVHASAYALRRHKMLCKRRSAVEAIIGHLKSEYRMGRNYLKGSIGDRNNALLAGMGFNLGLLLREIGGYFFAFLWGALGWLGLPRESLLEMTR
jgi:transposase, IS5 family